MSPVSDANDYKPPWLLRHWSLNYAWANAVRFGFGRMYKPYYEIEQLDLGSGSFLELQTSRTDQGNPAGVAVVLPPIEGGSGSFPTRGMVRAFNDRGWDAVVVVYRDTGRDMTTAMATYHGARRADVVTAVNRIKLRGDPYQAPYDRHVLVGLSMGSALALQYGAFVQSHTPIDTIVAVSAPIDFRESVDAWSSGWFGRLMSWFARRSMRKKLSAKADHNAPSPVEKAYREADATVARIKTVAEADQFAFTSLNGQRSGWQYWRDATTRYQLNNVEIPTLILSAKDDPLLGPGSYPPEDWVRKDGPVKMERSARGSHIGFVPRWVFRRIYWSEEKTLEKVGIL